MYSKKRYNYQFRLFVPIAAILWVFATALGIFHYQRSERLRMESLRQDIDHITSFLVKSFDSSGEVDKKTIRENYLSFLDWFYVNTDLDDISVTIWDNQNNCVNTHIGNIDNIPLPDGYDNEFEGKVPTGKVSVLNEDGEIEQVELSTKFYYMARKTPNKRYTVMTMMPFSTSNYEPYSSVYLWVLFVVTAIMTILIYIYTSHISKNVIAMHDFIEKGNKGEPIMQTEFANDELGDIGREIVALFDSRQRAFEEIENEHEIAIKAVQEKNNAKIELTNNINHELKTPIGILKGYIDTIIENPDMEEDIRTHFLNNCTTQITRLTDMVNDLSMIARLESGISNIPTEKLDMEYIVSTTSSDLSESGVVGNMKFVIDIPKGTFIRGNYNLFSNMVANLAKNAVAYSGGTEMGMKMIATNKRFYTFSFYDNGKGIADEYIPRLFERFFRVDSGRSRKKGGTGLGLPIVKTTVLTLGGTISARNRKGGGLEFIFTVPVWKDEESNNEGINKEK